MRNHSAHLRLLLDLGAPIDVRVGEVRQDRLTSVVDLGSEEGQSTSLRCKIQRSRMSSFASGTPSSDRPTRRSRRHPSALPCSLESGESLGS